jgi:sialate O-acetylesterase
MNNYRDIQRMTQNLRIKCVTILLSMFIPLFKLSAMLTMPSVFGDNMVLQQQTNVLIWGKSDQKKVVSIHPSWSQQSYSATPDKTGFWKVSIETPSAGGPFELKLNDSDELVFKNILIGEVWLCSGQSNMDIPMGGVSNIVIIKDANTTIIHSKNDQIRLYTVGYNPKSNLKDNYMDKWHLASPETVSRFSAVGYQFGKQLQEILGVPVGIIKCAKSGTKIESWMSEKLLQDDFNIPKLSGTSFPKTSELYNNMIMQIMGYGIKGILWYQGEGNVTAYELYSKELPAMVKEWRNQWGLGDIPFYFAQLAPYNTKTGKSPYMRQTMAECMKVIPNSGVVLLTDAGEENNIHPMDKKVVADRFLYWALAKTYNMKGFGFCGPIYKSSEIKGSEITVKFDYAETGLTTFGKELLNFEIAGEDTIYVQANAKITKEGVLVWNDAIKQPIAVRYAFKDFVVGELFNFHSLPASTFQTIKKTKE